MDQKEVDQKFQVIAAIDGMHECHRKAEIITNYLATYCGVELDPDDLIQALADTWMDLVEDVQEEESV